MMSMEIKTWSVPLLVSKHRHDEKDKMYYNKSAMGSIPACHYLPQM
jgi:hypothetical protein